MIQVRVLRLSPRVIRKIQKVLGIQPNDLGEVDAATLIEELCDTALMFDRESQLPESTPDAVSTGSPEQAPTSV